MGAIDWDALAKLADKKEKGDKNRQRKLKDLGQHPDNAQHVLNLLLVWQNRVINLEQRSRVL
jgi:hypothetical protein